MQAARRVAHVLVDAKAQDELVARALPAPLRIEIADMAVEGGVGPAAVEIDAQETFRRPIIQALGVEQRSNSGLGYGGADHKEGPASAPPALTTRGWAGAGQAQSPRGAAGRRRDGCR